MWRDFWYFNKTERRAVGTLTIVAVILQLAVWTSEYWRPFLYEQTNAYLRDKKALHIFQDSLAFAARRANGTGNCTTDGLSDRRSKPGRLFAFNPNTADSASLLALGLRPHAIRNLLKYRKKGGVFRKPEELARIYGLDEVLYLRLKPYVLLGKQKEAQNGESGSCKFSQEANENPICSGSRNAWNKERVLPVEERVPDTPSPLVEINGADTTALLALKGVGSVTARRIVRYRDCLGGFYSSSQLEEVYGLYPGTAEKIKSLLKVDTSLIVRINANKASLEKLKAHPYLSFYQARVIVELRKARSGIKSLRELAEYKEFTEVDMERLRWYLTFSVE